VAEAGLVYVAVLDLVVGILRFSWISGNVSMVMWKLVAAERRWQLDLPHPKGILID